MKQGKTYDCAIGCPVEATLDLIAGKWKGVILYHLLDGTLRFNAIGRRLTGVTQRTLTKQLRELEACGLVTRTVHAEVPPRVEYSLSTRGRSLEPVLLALKAWGEDYLSVGSPGRDAAGSASAPDLSDVGERGRAVVRAVGLEPTCP